MTILLLLLDRPTSIRPDLHYLCLWFKIPILYQALEEITCGTGTPKGFSFRLDPGELSSFQWNTCPLFCFCLTGQSQQGLTFISCVVGLKSQFCVRNWRRPCLVPGHQRTYLSDLIPVSYHLFSQTHGHHFVQPDRSIAQLGSDLFVMCLRCLASIFVADVWRVCLWFWDTKERPYRTLSWWQMAVEVRAGSLISAPTDDLGREPTLFLFVWVSYLGIGDRLRRGVKSKMRETKVLP
jgi:hypothetical protein